MKNIVSFETAKALKYAGFPQPGPEVGQFWRKDFGMPGLIQHISGSNIATICLVGTTRSEYLHTESLRFWIFAPTATDILEQLPERPIVYNPNECAWFIFEPPEITARIITISMDDNPAEAAAAAWLTLKKDLEV